MAVHREHYGMAVQRKHMQDGMVVRENTRGPGYTERHKRAWLYRENTTRGHGCTLEGMAVQSELRKVWLSV